MEFTVFHKTGEIHFNHGGYDDYDGDDGYDTEYELSDESCQQFICECIASQYVSKKEQRETWDIICEAVNDLIDAYDLFDKMAEDYYDELQEYAQEVYDSEY